MGSIDTQTKVRTNNSNKDVAESESHRRYSDSPPHSSFRGPKYHAQVLHTKKPKGGKLSGSRQNSHNLLSYKPGKVAKDMTENVRKTTPEQFPVKGNLEDESERQRLDSETKEDLASKLVTSDLPAVNTD